MLVVISEFILNDHSKIVNGQYLLAMVYSWVYFVFRYFNGMVVLNIRRADALGGCAEGSMES